MSNKASKKTLILMVTVFVLPVVLAKLALDHGWFEQAATNKGQLLQPTINVSSMVQDSNPKWRLVYVLPTDCDQACKNALFSINQVWLALGRESSRAEPMVFVTANSDTTSFDWAKDYPNVVVKPLSEKPDTPLLDSKVYIVDTLNNAVLLYQMDDDKDVAVMESRNILADMKKLLKLSRIG